jgi:15-cis-phytoene desaturase
VSFAEQSRSTFQNKRGRLSIILGKNQEYCNYSAEDLLKIVTKELKKVGIDITNNVIRCRKISEKEEFYSLTPGSEKLRPLQDTKIKGLILAGDYTKTSSLCTMEGAVISGKKAAKLCTKK